MGQPGYYHQPPDYQTKKSLGILNGLLEQRLEILREIEGSRRLFASYGMPVKAICSASSRLTIGGAAMKAEP
jgi:hypothetical protein